MFKMLAKWTLCSYLLLVIILIQNVSVKCLIDEDEESKITRYANLIRQGIQDVLNFVPPENASQYAGTGKCLMRDQDLEECNYDFIIVGSGAAGSVIGSRISEIKNATILVVEAGHYENDFIDVPFLTAFTLGTEYNWAYKSIPQKSCCLGMVNKQCQFHRGRGVGGTTLINSAVYSRASAADYNLWGQFNPGWSYDDVLPFFLKSEDAHFEGADEGFHSTGGLFNVEMSSYTTPHLDAFLAANEALGFQQIDYNGQSQLGVSRIQYNTKNGRRFTTGNSFLTPALNRNNIKFSIDTYATKILFDRIQEDREIDGQYFQKGQLRAIGLTVLKNGCEYKVKVAKEIILAAGTIASPQILLQSGIGPRKHLREVGVKPLLDLPVGNNLQDHVVIKGLSLVSNTSVVTDTLEDNLRMWFKDQGPFTFAAGHGAVGFYKTTNSRTPDSPDLEFIFMVPNRTTEYFQQSHGYTDETFNALTKDLDNFSTMSVLITLEHPASVGTVRLRSNNPLDYPLIDPKFLEDKDGYDIETLYQGLLLLEQMLNQESFQKLGAWFAKIDLPECKGLRLFFKAYWYCFIRQTSDELYHPVGTNKMAPRNHGGVVDEWLKVYDIPNLRVADASVIPFSMSGHTSAPSVMIGERCAAFLKDKYYKDVSGADIYDDVH